MKHHPRCCTSRRSLRHLLGTILLPVALFIASEPSSVRAQTIASPAAKAEPTGPVAAIKGINIRMGKLRSLPDDQRRTETSEIAVEIGRLPASDQKLSLALGLSNLATEGDPGPGGMQMVATIIENSAREQLPGLKTNYLNSACQTLAALERYEGIKTAMGEFPQFQAAKAVLEETEKKVEALDFTLPDLDGKDVSLKSLRASGKVVVVNFWATWCPPCRKELPDLVELAKEYKDDLVILGVTIDTPQTADIKKLQKFQTEHSLGYPILLDPDSKVLKGLGHQGIPFTFIYNKQGKMAALAMDMRTRGQFDVLLAKAGLGTSKSK